MFSVSNVFAAVVALEGFLLVESRGGTLVYTSPEQNTVLLLLLIASMKQRRGLDPGPREGEKLVAPRS